MKKALICMLQLHKNSGSARTSHENIRYFLSRGYQVHLASMTMDQEMVASMGAIPHKMLPFFKSTGLYRRYWYNWQVQRLRKKISPQITVGHGDIFSQDVLTLHNSVFLASELVNGAPLEAKNEMAIIHGECLKGHLFKKMIANSKIMKDDTTTRFGVPSEDIEIIYPSLDTKVFMPMPELRSKLRHRFGFDNKVVVALVTSGNFKKRGLDIFIKSLDLLPLAIQQIASFRVVGKDEKNLFQHPLLNYDPSLVDIQSYYNAIDIFVLPARIEEFGRVVLEAMGCGLPIITTNKVGASELLSGKSSEFVIPPNNPEALAKALIKLISDPLLRKQIGDSNVQLARQESEDELFSKFDKIFLNL